MFILGKASRGHLVGVHEPMVKVVQRAINITPRDFGVIDGLRSLAEQQEYYRTGKSRTMNSRHLTGHAVDLGVYIDGQMLFEPWEFYEELAEVMFQAAHLESEVIEWGGHFGRIRRDGRLVPFRDGVHFQLPERLYGNAPIVLPDENPNPA